jgi:uncharacterized protein (TIGR02145 family)
MKIKILLLTIAILISAINLAAQVNGMFTDRRDNRDYRTVNIGSQTWMAENLNVSVFRNGDPIPEAKTDEEWKKAGENNKPVYCSYYTNPIDAKKYGKLYNSYAMMDIRGLAPTGWHLPSKKEWATLCYYLGGTKAASDKMKSTTGWSKNGNNSSGFSGFATPTRGSNGFFSGIPLTADWWSSTSEDSEGGEYYDCCSLNEAGDRMESGYDKEDGVPVRCISDMSAEDTKKIADYNKGITNPKSAKDYATRGISRFDLQDFAGALADFNQAIKLDPAYADAYYNRGLAKAAQQDYAGAITDFNKTISINPKYSDAYIGRATIKVEQQDLPSAMADLNKAITIDPEEANAYTNRGRIKAAQQDMQGAIADFSKAIEFGFIKYEAYNMRGLAKFNLQDYPAALADYSEAIAELEMIISVSVATNEDATTRENKLAVFNLKVAEIYYNRGLADHGLMDYKEAIKSYSKAIELNPQYAAAYYSRGFAKTILVDYPGAITDFNNAIAISPRYPAAYYYRALAKANQKDFAQAIADYDKTIELEPSYAEAYYNRAFAKSALKDYPGAIADNTKTIELNPGSPEPYYNRANLKYTLNDFTGAVADYTKTIELSPKNADAYYYRGAAKLNLGQKEGGCADLKKAGELGNTDAAETIKANCN